MHIRIVDVDNTYDAYHLLTIQYRIFQDMLQLYIVLLDLRMRILSLSTLMHTYACIVAEGIKTDI